MATATVKRGVPAGIAEVLRKIPAWELSQNCYQDVVARVAHLLWKYSPNVDPEVILAYVAGLESLDELRRLLDEYD